jgi:hypothetical protein
MSTGTPIRPRSSHSAGSLPGRTDPRAGVVATGVLLVPPNRRRAVRVDAGRSGQPCSLLRRDEPLTEVLDRLRGGTRTAVVVGGEPVGLLPRPSVCAASDSDGGSGTPPRRDGADAQGRHRGGGRPGRASAGAAACGTLLGDLAHTGLPRSQTSVGQRGVPVLVPSTFVHADRG